MAFRKFAADYIFTGSQMLDKNAVLITDENGKIIELATTAEVKDGIERYNGILTPGFVNCHCHLELSHMLGAIPQHTGMVEFLLTVMNNRSSPASVVNDAVVAEITYMREKGIVAVGDVCNTADTLSAKEQSDLYFHNFIEAIGVSPASARQRFEAAEKLYQKFTSELNASSIVPHALYSVSDELLQLIDRFEQTAILSIHNQESEAELEFLKKGSGDMLNLYRKLGIDKEGWRVTTKSPLQHLLQLISPMHSLFLVHNCYTSVEDLDYVDTHSAEIIKLWWCVCPNANSHIGNKLPDAVLLQRMGDNVVIGTDSLASNTQLNILEELKTLQQQYSWLETEQLLKWATINGANALQISGRYGTFEKGKRPGIVIIHGGKGLALDGTVSRRVL